MAQKETGIVTMSNFFIKDVRQHKGEEITILGWVFNKRSSGSILFLQVRDGTGFIQVTVAKQDVSEQAFNDASRLTLETSVAIRGLVKEEPRAPGDFEVLARDLSIISLSDEYPISKKDHGPDFLLSHRHLWLRSARQWAILRVRNQIINAMNEFLQKEGYTRIDSPIITPSACEGTTTLFQIDYFGEPAYLSQSGQLYLEAAIASVGRCYDFGPVLRAEKSKTRRHLTEFWMMDAEAAFVDFEGILEVEEKLVQHVVRSVLDRCAGEMSVLERDIAPLRQVDEPFLRLPYAEAIKKLNELGSDIAFGTDFGNDDETLLMSHYQQPVFVTHFPKEFKAFYFKRPSGNDDATLSADLLAPEGYGEIAGGGEREANYQTLLKRIDEHGYKREDYDWYLDLRKYGSVPHSGFGIGLERLVAWICKLEHVRESIPFPRLLGRFKP